jgi:pimeloyl-ACP methyl ester carboxylesterase
VRIISVNTGARVLRFRGLWVLVAAWMMSAATVPLFASADGAVASRSPVPVSYILVGFAGGFVRHDNPHHGPVQLAQRIQSSVPNNAYVQVFENRRRKSAYDTILHLLDSNRDGVLSAEEKARARIILFGHSWGASAVVMLARELNRAGIPVLLTVQVDSVAKPWQRDGLIPANVAEAVNFFQPHGIVRGRQRISAVDPLKTQILGNYRFDYHKDPVKCEGTSWFDRTITPDHMQSECDPHLWSQVESLIRERMNPKSSIAASAPLP